MLDDKLNKAEKYTREGVRLANNHSLDEAIVFFKKAHNISPSFHTHYYLGLSYQNTDKLDLAEKHYKSCMKLSPSYAMAYNNLAAIYLGQKKFKEAEKLLKIAVDWNPKNAFAHNNLGNVYKHQSKNDLARKSYKKALSIDPDIVETINNLGLLCVEEKNPKKGVVYFKKALELNPNYSPAYMHLSVAYSKMGDTEKSIEALENYVEQRPEDVNGISYLANLYVNAGETKRAKKLYERALKLNPNSGELTNDMGNFYKYIGDTKKALEYYHKALKIDSKLAGVYNNIGIIHLDRMEFDEAEENLDKAIKYKPDFSSAYYHKGLIYELNKDLGQSSTLFKKSLDLQPVSNPALSLYTYDLMQMCEWKEFKKLTKILDDPEYINYDEAGGPIETPFLNTIRKQDLKHNLQIAKIESEQRERKVSDLRTVHSYSDRKKKKKIRVGYLSSDYQTHATAHLTLSLYKTHDRSKFEIYAYSYGPPDESIYRKKIAKDCDEFIDIFDSSFKQTADRIYKDKIDILVDLKGHTRHNRIEIMALKSAPIQVEYLGHPGTTGASFIDYMITDKIVTPNKDSKYYTEKFAYMPDCYQVNNSQREIIAKKMTRKSFGLPEKKFVYSSFNRLFKVDIETMNSWIKILKKVPGSVIWLYGDNPFGQKNIKKYAKSKGISPNRFIFSESLPNPVHLKRLQLSDLSLDTFTCNGHTTTSDALWAGVPVVTKMGNHFASRVSASILTAVGLEELITKTNEEYANLAVSLAKDKKKLNSMRKTLSKNRLSHPLFDTQLFVNNLEKAYLEVYKNYQKGNKPRPIST